MISFLPMMKIIIISRLLEAWLREETLCRFLIGNVFVIQYRATYLMACLSIVGH